MMVPARLPRNAAATALVQWKGARAVFMCRVSIFFQGPGSETLGTFQPVTNGLCSRSACKYLQAGQGICFGYVDRRTSGMSFTLAFRLLDRDFAHTYRRYLSPFLLSDFMPCDAASWSVPCAEGAHLEIKHIMPDAG